MGLIALFLLGVAADVLYFHAQPHRPPILDGLCRLVNRDAVPGLHSRASDSSLLLRLSVVCSRNCDINPLRNRRRSSHRSPLILPYDSADVLCRNPFSSVSFRRSLRTVRRFRGGCPIVTRTIHQPYAAHIRPDELSFGPSIPILELARLSDSNSHIISHN